MDESCLTRILAKVIDRRNALHLATKVTVEPPAAQAALRDREAFIGSKLARSHRTFLEQHDGLRIGCFYNENPDPNELAGYEVRIYGCDGIRARTQNLRDFFDLAYIYTVDGATSKTARQFYVVADNGGSDMPILAFLERRMPKEEYQLIDADLRETDWLDDPIHPYVNLVDQSFEAFLRKSLEHLQLTGDRFEYWLPPGS